MGGAITGDLSAWTPTQATWSLPASKLSGPGLLFVITSGIASEGRPILLGATKPVHILTPTATVRRLVNMTALCVVDANAQQRSLF